MNQKRMICLAALAIVEVAGCSLPSLAIPECAINSIVGVNFGSYDVFSIAPTDSTGNITYRCSNMGQSMIAIDISRGNSSSYLPRQMYQGSETFDYNLFLDAAKTVVWGDGSSDTSHYGPVNPPENADVTVQIYGRIPARQNVKAGNYIDTVTVTVNF